MNKSPRVERINQKLKEFDCTIVINRVYGSTIEYPLIKVYVSINVNEDYVIGFSKTGHGIGPGRVNESYLIEQDASLDSATTGMKGLLDFLSVKKSYKIDTKLLDKGFKKKMFDLLEFISSKID